MQVSFPSNSKCFTKPSWSPGQVSALEWPPASLHQGLSPARLDRSHQDGTGLSLCLRDHVETAVGVDRVDVGYPGRAKHGRISGSLSAAGMACCIPS